MRVPFNSYAMLDLRCTSIVWAQRENIRRPAGFVYHRYASQASIISRIVDLFANLGL